MSGYYQLLPTRPDGDPPPSNTVRDPPSLLTRLLAALPFSFLLYDRYHSFPNFDRSNSLYLWSKGSKRPTTLYAAGVSATVLLVLALVVYHERMKEYIMDTFFGPAPPAACLRDPSAAASYVRWRPLAADDQLVYHCIKVPHSSEPPPLRPYQSLPSTCRDAFFENGDMCNHQSAPTRFDLVWTWVNGSDPLLHDAMAAAEHSATGDENVVGLQQGQKLYRSVLFLSLTRPLVLQPIRSSPLYPEAFEVPRGAAEDVNCRRLPTAPTYFCLPYKESARPLNSCPSLNRVLNLINPPMIGITMNYDTPCDLLSPIFVLIPPPFTSSPRIFLSPHIQKTVASVLACYPNGSTLPHKALGETPTSTSTWSITHNCIPSIAAHHSIGTLCILSFSPFHQRTTA